MYSELIGNYKKHRIKSLCDNKLTINSPSNMMRQFTNNVKEVGMVFGQLLIPVLQKVMPILNGVTIAIKRLLVSIASLLGISLDLSSFGQGYSGLEEGLDDVADGFDNATASAKKFKTYTLGIDELNIQPEQTDSSGGGAGVGGGDFIDLTDEILQATEEYERVWQEAFDNMENTAQSWADSIYRIFQPLEDMFANLSLGEFELAGEDFSDFFMQFLDIDWDSVYEVAKDWGKNLAEFMNGAISPEDFDKIGETIAGYLNTALSFLNSFGETFDWNEFGESIGSGIKTFFETFDFELAKETIEKITGGIADSIESAIEEITGDDITVPDVLGTAVISAIGVQLAMATKNPFLINVTVGLATFNVGFDLGKELGKMLAPDDWDWYETFSFDTFFEDVTRDFESTFKGIERMMTDFTNNPIIAGIAQILIQNISPLGAILMNWHSIFDSIAYGLESLKFKISVWWASVKLYIQQNILSKFTKENIVNVLGGIVEGAQEIFNNVKNTFIALMNGLIDRINEMMHITWDAVTIAGETIIPSGDIQLITIPNIPQYRTGGFPEDGLFMANHNELVGQFSNGRTAVANNEQIVSGIEGGVERAVARVLAPYLSDIAQNTRETADKDFAVNIGDREIARANARGSRSMGYALIT